MFFEMTTQQETEKESAHRTHLLGSLCRLKLVFADGGFRLDELCAQTVLKRQCLQRQHSAVPQVVRFPQILQKIAPNKIRTTEQSISLRLQALDKMFAQLRMSHVCKHQLYMVTRLIALLS